LFVHVSCVSHSLLLYEVASAIRQIKRVWRRETAQFANSTKKRVLKKLTYLLNSDGYSSAMSNETALSILGSGSL
jgi:hypothetical protein